MTDNEAAPCREFPILPLCFTSGKDGATTLDERPRSGMPDPYVRMAQECPRERGYEPHKRGDYYHVYNRSGVCCVMGFVPRQDLSKLIGRWEI